jgi:hypothetical protein
MGFASVVICYLLFGLTAAAIGQRTWHPTEATDSSAKYSPAKKAGRREDWPNGVPLSEHHAQYVSSTKAMSQPAQ